MTEKASELAAVVSCIDPDAYAPGTVLGDEVDLSKFHKVLYVVDAGDIDSGGTVDYQILGSATSGGSFAAISGKKITQLTQAGTDSNKQAIIEIDCAEAKAAGKNYIKDELVVGTGSADACATGFGFNARYGPASASDLASVDEIVA